MNDMFMNSRGLGDLAKHLHTADCVRDKDLDFVAISEASRCDFPVHVLNRLSGGQEFTWHYLPPCGRSGGILLGVKTSSMDVLAFSGGEVLSIIHIEKTQRLKAMKADDLLSDQWYNFALASWQNGTPAG